MDKKCFKCGKEKPRSEYYKHPAMGDGLLGKCKECTKSDVFKHRQNNQEKLRIYEKSRPGSRYKNGSVGYQQEYKKKYPLRWAARMAIQRLKRSGELIRRPCVKCGEKASGHHEDYRKPLELVWLCRIHHRKRHAEMNRLGISLHG